MTTSLIDLGMGQIRIGRGHPLALATTGTSYGPAEGDPELRRVVAEHHGVRPVEIAITTGASLGLTATLATLARPGSILCPHPHYPLYPEVAQVLGLDAVYYDATRLRDPDCCVAAFARLIDSNTRAILLNLPANPTGDIPSRKALECICELAANSDLLVISDEVYADLTYDAVDWPNVRSMCGGNCVQLRSFSKTLQMPGERLGYLIAQPHRVRTISRCHWAMAMSPPASAQILATTMLRSNYTGYLERLRSRLRLNRDQALGVLGSCSRIQFDVPSAGIFFWIKVREPHADSRYLASECSTKAGVLVTPGASFGVHSPVYLRVSFAVSAPEIAQGYRALVDYLNACEPCSLTYGVK